MSHLWTDALNFNFLQQVKGFAFYHADLNRTFTDGSAIDRIFQNTLVQTCWSYGFGCTFITHRPGDVTTLVSPVLPGNPNSGKALANPILGCNQAIRDRLVALYPNAQISGHNPSVVFGQISEMLQRTNRDTGVPLNLDVAYAAKSSDSDWLPDDVFGTTPVVAGTDIAMSSLFTFVVTLGITTIGVCCGSKVPAADSFRPQDGSVNNTGEMKAWSVDGIMNVFGGRTPSSSTTPDIPFFVKFNSSFTIVA